MRLKPDFTPSSNWPSDPLGPMGVRNLRGFAFGDARATALTIAPNGDVWVSGAGYDDLPSNAAPVLWCLNPAGDHRGMGPFYGDFAGEYAGAVYHPSGHVLLAGWIKSSYQPSLFPMYRAQ